MSETQEKSNDGYTVTFENVSPMQYMMLFDALENSHQRVHNFHEDGQAKDEDLEAMHDLLDQFQKGTPNRLILESLSTAGGVLRDADAEVIPPEAAEVIEEMFDAIEEHDSVDELAENMDTDGADPFGIVEELEEFDGEDIDID